MSPLLSHAHAKNIVIFAGAGLSTGKPSALPSWKPLNKLIAQALRERLESALRWKQQYLEEVMSSIDKEREDNRFPPEYQAQLIEEMCGERYFRGLQALDVDVTNAGHELIAALAATGAIRAIITTNFDCLIERALERAGVRYHAAYDDPTFSQMTQRLAQADNAGLPIIKIHGSVRAHLSMIDTLKQRKRGRSRHLQDCLDPLHSAYWLYLGFSAADLEAKSDYLGLTAGAPRSPGATYVVYPIGQPPPPATPKLSDGAKILLAAYGERGSVLVEHVADTLRELCSGLRVSPPAISACEEALGLAAFEQNIKKWADDLTPAAAGLCLAALFEAVGLGEAAVRMLDRLVRKDLHDEQGTPDYQALQLHHGRLGAAWGRFVAVTDINGAQANASVESIQSLARLQHTELDFAAGALLTCMYLWLGDGKTATHRAARTLIGFATGEWASGRPSTDEEALDAWLAAAQVSTLAEDAGLSHAVISTLPMAVERAKRCGDVTREARAVALHLLALARTNADLPAIADQFKAPFEEAARVGDHFALGMRSLALGRWHVGIGGLTLAAALGHTEVASRASEHLRQAVVEHFERLGMHPWITYALIQQAKAFGDLRQFDRVAACFERIQPDLERFPVLAPHAHEAVGQLHRMQNNPAAQQSFTVGAQIAEDAGLTALRDMILSNLKISGSDQTLPPASVTPEQR